MLGLGFRVLRVVFFFAFRFEGSRLVCLGFRGLGFT